MIPLPLRSLYLAIIAISIAWLGTSVIHRDDHFVSGFFAGLAATCSVFTLLLLRAKP